MFGKKKTLHLQEVSTIDKDYWGKIIFRTRKILAATPRRQGRVLKVNMEDRTFELVSQKSS